jgi:hypothetical protein
MAMLTFDGMVGVSREGERRRYMKLRRVIVNGREAFLSCWVYDAILAAANLYKTNLANPITGADIGGSENRMKAVSRRLRVDRAMTMAWSRVVRFRDYGRALEWVAQPCEIDVSEPSAGITRPILLHPTISTDSRDGYNISWLQRASVRDFCVAANRILSGQAILKGSGRR